MLGGDRWCLLKGHLLSARMFWISWLSQDTQKSQLCSIWASLMLGDGLQEAGSSAESQLGFVVLTPSFITTGCAGQRSPSEEGFWETRKILKEKFSTCLCYLELYVEHRPAAVFLPETNSLCIDLMRSLSSGRGPFLQLLDPHIFASLGLLFCVSTQSPDMVCHLLLCQVSAILCRDQAQTVDGLDLCRVNSMTNLENYRKYLSVLGSENSMNQIFRAQEPTVNNYHWSFRCPLPFMAI